MNAWQFKANGRSVTVNAGDGMAAARAGFRAIGVRVLNIRQDMYLVDTIGGYGINENVKRVSFIVKRIPGKGIGQ